MNNMEIRKQIEASVALKRNILQDQAIIDKVERMISLILTTYRAGGKVLFCGNGGSAADAQHLAAELSGRFYLDRPPLNAEALHVNSSFVTATANDHAFDKVFSRMIEAVGQPHDCLLALSTSGQSANIIRALETARNKGMKTIGMTGEKPGAMDARCDVLIHVPSSDTARIQEVHMLLGHVICENVEKELFS